MGQRSSRRIKRERKTICFMVQLYCSKHHDTERGVLCKSCEDFLRYANKRLDHCPYQEDKPTCAHCSIHCYKKDMQAQARALMRYSGPRLILRHPVLALMHVFDGWKQEPQIDKIQKD